MTDFWEQRIIGNARINEPINIYWRPGSYRLEENRYARAAKLFNNSLDFGEFAHHIDVVDINLSNLKMNGGINEDIYFSSFSLVLRNRLGENHQINFSPYLNDNNTLIKSDYIDVLKKGKNPKFVNGCNSNWEVLSEERYPLKTLDSEYKPSGSKIVDNFTLKPYEMAQYHIIPYKEQAERVKDAYNNLERRENDKISCKPLNLVKAIREGYGSSLGRKDGISLLLPFLLMAMVVILLGISLWLYLDLKKDKREGRFEIEIGGITRGGQERYQIREL